jgi:hypothetical protein
MILNALAIFDVVVSLVGIGSGVAAAYELLKAKTPGGWTQAFRHHLQGAGTGPMRSPP